MDVDDLADKEARAVLVLEERARDTLEVVVLAAKGDCAPKAPRL